MKRLICLWTPTSEHRVCSCVRVEGDSSSGTWDGPAKSANGHRIFVAIPQIHNFIEKSNIKNYNGLVAAVRPVGCIKTFQIATRSTETSECEIFSYIIMISVLKLNPPVLRNNTRNNTTNTLIG